MSQQEGSSVDPEADECEIAISGTERKLDSAKDGKLSHVDSPRELSEFYASKGSMNYVFSVLS